jgi:hypothetical protein
MGMKQSLQKSCANLIASNQVDVSEKSVSSEAANAAAITGTASGEMKAKESSVIRTEHAISPISKSQSLPTPISETSLPVPTKDELQSLRHVTGPIPWIAFVLCVVEFAERASYYGAVQVFNNFLQFPLPLGNSPDYTLVELLANHRTEGNGAGAPPKVGTAALTEQPAGAIGGGIQYANAFTLSFKFLAYTVPILGAWIGDVKIGRYNAIMMGVLICGLAHIIQILGAIPSVLQKGQGAPPFLISLFLLAVGAGEIVKHCWLALIIQASSSPIFSRLFLTNIAIRTRMSRCSSLGRESLSIQT